MLPLPFCSLGVSFPQGIFLFFFKLGGFLELHGRETTGRAGLLSFSSPPSCKVQSKTISLSTAFPLGCFSLHAKETQVSQFLISAEE